MSDSHVVIRNGDRVYVPGLGDPATVHSITVERDLSGDGETEQVEVIIRCAVKIVTVRRR